MICIKLTAANSFIGNFFFIATLSFKTRLYEDLLLTILNKLLTI